MRRGNRRGYRQFIESDLEIMPLMNLFVALIPMLLISAVFVNVSVIDMKLPTDVAEAEAASNTQKALNLAVTIRDEHFVVEGRKLRKQVVAREDEDADSQLASILDGIKQQYPDNEEIMIISQSRTRYEDIILVMDVSRESGMGSASLLGDPGDQKGPE
jgi:biopolymer transport protein ExbD